ncbi:DMT family transporter [Oceanomicrobium pacificus]|uniref:EamA family transporter n=1 Tax=Oceanomicrobium pacificus TaxID=2692916 RepID=A0A6B0TWX1_9RHOB|nr:EamA family transporter [Oceanomicrobium pacificus]MXU65523.1 EamA family transporter [Oceanomicrobium pacificus]
MTVSDKPAAPAAEGTDWLSAGGVGLLVVIWGSSFFLTSLSLDGYAPLAVAGGRIFIAAIFVTAFALLSGQGLPRSLRDWGWSALVGIVSLALPFSLLSWAQLFVPTNIVAIFISAVPLFILLLARLVLKEAISLRKWTGFGIGFLGLVWLSSPGSMPDLPLRDLALPIAALALTCLCYATGAILIRIMPPMRPLQGTAGAMICASAVTLPLGLGAGLAAAPLVTLPALALLALGLLPTGLAQTLRFFIIRRRGPVYMSIVGYLIPLWAGFLGIVVLGEELRASAALAYGLIILGVLVSRDGRGKRVPPT